MLDIKSWFRGSVLEEVLIPYTLPGLMLALLGLALLPQGAIWERVLKDGGVAWAFIVPLWGVSIALGGCLSALGRFLGDIGVMRRVLDAIVTLMYGDQTEDILRMLRIVKAMGVIDDPKRYELVRSRFYLWGEFNKGMAFAVAILAVAYPTIANRYFPGSLEWSKIVIPFAILIVISLIVNWHKNMRMWEVYERWQSQNLNPSPASPAPPSSGS
jgi:hypothetical protein